MSKSLEHKLNSYGFDYFAGKVIFDNSREDYAILNLRTGGLVGYSTIKGWFRKFCRLIEDGKRVLLTKSPGREGRKVTNSGELLEVLISSIECCYSAKVPTSWRERIEKHKKIERVLSGCDYVPICQDRLKELKLLYNALYGHKGWPNPFKNQPK